MGRRTVLQYDERGHLLTYSAPGSAPVSYSYNSEGRRVSATIGKGNLAHTTHYSYDPNTGAIVTTLPDGTSQTTKYDKAGRATSIASDDGSTVLASYDAAGRVVQIQAPGGLNFTIGVSPAGRSTAFIPPMVGNDGSAETSSYDVDGQLTNISGVGSRVVNMVYDSAGRPTSWTFDQGKRTASYDQHSGLMIEATDPSGVKTNYGYAGNVLTGLKWSGLINGAVSVALDSDGRVSRESANGASQLDYKYDSAGNLIGVGPLSLTRDSVTGLATRSIVGVVETKQEFDANRQLVRRTTTGAGKVVLDQHYSYDSLGRVKSVSDTTADGRSQTTEYSYDNPGRLAAARRNGQKAESYSYDPAGNRIGVTRANAKVKSIYDERDRLVAQGDTRFAWALDGSLSHKVEGSGTTQFVYDDFGALRRVKLADGHEIKYVVDADGRRVGREAAGKGIGYLYRVDGLIAAEMDGAGKIISRFAYDDLHHLVLAERGGVSYRIVTDHLGSPRLVLDSQTGAIVEQIDYDAWGNITRDSAPGLIPISFAGGLRDPDTGLVRFGARDYDPATGRWTAADPIRFAGGDSNLYRYAAADPVNFVDASGLLTCVETGRSSTCYDNPPQNGGWFPHPVSQGNQPGWCTDSGFCMFGPPFDPNQPSTGNPPPTGSPSPGGSSWSCSGITCSGPNGSCDFGTCGSGPNGFWCSGIMCEGPDRSCDFCSIGDTHLLSTVAHFDFQAAGEFRATAWSDGKLVIQSRQEPVLGGTEITFNTAVAANVNGDRVGVYAKEPSFLIVNGAALNGGDVEKRLPHGGKVRRHGGTVNLAWPDGTRLNVVRLGSTLNYGVVPAANSSRALNGLLGNSTAGAEGALIGRDGTTLSRSDRAFQTKLYGEFGNSWRIKQSESLFHYWPGESTASFTNLKTPTKEVRASSLSPEGRSRAEQVCKAAGIRGEPILDDCILDVGITGIPAFAAASVGMAVSRGTAAPTAASTISSANGTPTGAPTDNFKINIGDAVSLDRPEPGAGQIGRAGQKQTYLFSGRASDSVYIAVGPCDGANPVFDLLKPDNSVLDGTGGCHDFGPVKLPVNGTYRIEASASGAPTHYSFSLRSAVPNEFSIKIGDAISPDHPAGAGVIKQPGQRQSYSFKARSGDVIYVGIGPCDGTPPILDIFAPDNHRVDGQIGCHDLGRVVLPQKGTYRILVRADGLSVRYSFSLHPVPPDRHFAVRLPLTVSLDAPPREAGHVSAQGAQQFYDFDGSSGSQVHVEGRCSAPCPHLGIRVTPVGDNGRIGFLPLDHLNFDWKLLPGGKHTIQVRSDGYVGAYAFTAYEEKQQPR
jgi:RHS repeat-associated protein